MPHKAGVTRRGCFHPLPVKLGEENVPAGKTAGHHSNGASKPMGLNQRSCSMELATIDGSCHCGSVRWHLDHTPDSATACNCTVCRRYGVLWAYGHENDGVRISGNTRAYWRGGGIEFHFCAVCGGVAYWRGRETDATGQRRIGVNLRMAEPASVAPIPIEHLDGLDTFEPLPRDGRCVGDYWF